MELALGIEGPPPGSDNRPLTEREKEKLFWFKFIIGGLSSALSLWNFSGVTSLPSGALGAIMLYNCMIYGTFSAVSAAALLHYGECRTCLGVMSSFALAHMEYLVLLICFEGFRLAGIGMEASFAVYASLTILVAIMWYFWPEGIMAPAPGDNAPLTESEEEKLFWNTVVINGCSVTLTGWNAMWIKSLPTSATDAIVFYNFLVYGLFSSVSGATLLQYGKQKTWLGVMSLFALAHIEYFLFLICFEGYRLGGIEMETSIAICASLSSLAAVMWYVWPEGIPALAPGDNAPLTESEEFKLFCYTLIIDGCSVALSGWNAIWIKSPPSGAVESTLIYNFFLYGMFSAVSLAALRRYGKRRTWLGVMSFFALVHVEYFLILICFEGHRLLGTDINTNIAIYSSLSTVAALGWSVFVWPEWWEKRIHARYIGHHLD